jgi:UDP-glucose 4-epimerase
VAAGRKERSEIFGTDYPTPDRTRSETASMSKTLRAHLLALEDAQVGTHKVYNLGNGSGYFVSEVV